MDRKDVINKVFPHCLFGYDPIAVDAFLDEVIREFDRLNNSIDVLKFRLAHELGDAYHQNDVLSRELEFAKYGRRVTELLSAPAGDKALPEPEEPAEPEAPDEPEEPVEPEAPDEPEEPAETEAPEEPGDPDTN